MAKKIAEESSGGATEKNADEPFIPEPNVSNVPSPTPKNNTKKKIERKTGKN